MATVVIGAIVLAAMAAAARYIVKSHREGKCVGCSGCSGHCDHCTPEQQQKIHGPRDF